MNSTNEAVILSEAQLRALIEALLAGAGLGQDAASEVADVFVEADLRGIGTQGLDHLPSMLDQLLSGKVRAHGEPRTVVNRQAIALIDGPWGPGQIAAKYACDLTVTKARDVGIAAAGIQNSSDVYMLGFYAERIARARLIGIVFTTSPPLVHPHGGHRRMLGTNPIAVGIPWLAKDPILMDIATSAISFSKARQASYMKIPLQSGLAVDATGRPTTDAEEAMHGALSPLGGHKGFALGIWVAVMAGPLVGAAIGTELAGWIDEGPLGSKGHFIMALDPSVFGNSDEFLANVTNYANSLKDSAPDGAVRIPGERAFATRAARQREGSPIHPHALSRIRPYADQLGVSMPNQNER